MSPAGSAIAISAAVTGVVALLGALVLLTVSRRRAAWAALAAPLVVVISLAAGVAAATRAMAIGIHDYRTLIFVLLAGAPMAVLVGAAVARRIFVQERAAAAERAERDRAASVEADRRELIRWLGHDLRTPLSGIRVLAESLREKESGATPAAAALDGILRESDRLDDMVADIAELSRLQGEMSATVRREGVHLADLVSDAAACVRPLAEAARVELTPGALTDVRVTVDTAALTRAVTNLLRNAVQHTPPGGRVLISVQSPARVLVADGCGGVPEADLAHVFEPGWRADAARTSGIAGMGLGLAITREIARSHDGDVDAANLPDGSGCVFTLRLPAA